MPFVNIQILEGHPQERKDEMARRVADAVSELSNLPPVWVAFEHVSADDRFVGGRSLRKIKAEREKK